MELNREQVDTIFKNLKELCLCRGCLFENFLDVYHKKVTELIDKQAKRIEALESENKHLKSHRFVNIGEIPDLTERARELAEKLALEYITIEIPIEERSEDGTR